MDPYNERPREGCSGVASSRAASTDCDAASAARHCSWTRLTERTPAARQLRESEDHQMVRLLLVLMKQVKGNARTLIGLSEYADAGT